jgi:hypothetical protein
VSLSAWGGELTFFFVSLAKILVFFGLRFGDRVESGQNIEPEGLFGKILLDKELRPGPCTSRLILARLILGLSGQRVDSGFAVISNDTRKSAFRSSLHYSRFEFLSKGCASHGLLWKTCKFCGKRKGLVP